MKLKPAKERFKILTGIDAEENVEEVLDYFDSYLEPSDFNLENEEEWEMLLEPFEQSPFTLTELIKFKLEMDTPLPKGMQYDYHWTYSDLFQGGLTAIEDFEVWECDMSPFHYQEYLKLHERISNKWNNFYEKLSKFCGFYFDVGSLEDCLAFLFLTGLYKNNTHTKPASYAELVATGFDISVITYESKYSVVNSLPVFIEPENIRLILAIFPPSNSFEEAVEKAHYWLKINTPYQEELIGIAKCAEEFDKYEWRKSGYGIPDKQCLLNYINDRGTLHERKSVEDVILMYRYKNNYIPYSSFYQSMANFCETTEEITKAAIDMYRSKYNEEEEKELIRIAKQYNCWLLEK